MGLKNNPREHEDTTYASVLADGKIHVSVPEGTEGATVRHYETSDGKEGSKTEHVYTELTGIIRKVDFHEGEYGLNLQIVVGEEDDEDAKPVTLSLSTESNFGEDMMKKLPNVDIKKPVKLVPYSFLNDKGKKTRGINIFQTSKKGEEVKILNHYYDTEEKVPTNGCPKPPKGKTLTKSQWRKYFTEVREFLIEETRGLFEAKAEGESDADVKARQKRLKAF